MPTLDEQAATIETILPDILRRIFRQAPAHHGEDLPIAQLRMCDILAEGPSPISCIAARIHVSASSVTQIADRLERAGLVERVPELEDRRVRKLRLTAHGEEWMQARREQRRGQIRDALEFVAPEDRSTVIDGLMLLADGCRRHDASKHGACSTEERECT